MKNTTQKTLIVTLPETVVARNILRTDFFPTLKEQKGLRIVLLTTPDMEAAFREEFRGENIFVESLFPQRPRLGEKILAFFARNGMVTGTNTLMQHRSYENGESKIHPWVKWCIGKLFERMRLLRTLLRALELRIPPTKEVVSVFDRHNPDLLFSTVCLNIDIDIPLLREARRRGVYTVGMVRGWDNLTTYGILRILPDQFFAQNPFLASQVIALHDMQPTRVSIVGTPFLDLYLQKEFYQTREEYCAELGIDPSSRILLYAAIGDFLFPKEGEIAEVLESLIETDMVPKNCIALFRAHPAFSSPMERMRSLVHVIPERSAEYKTDVLHQWDMKHKHTVHLINTIRHAAVVITAGSTMMIEGAVLDRPVITVAFDGRSKERYWFSIARFHDMATHIVNLIKTGGVRVAHSPEDLGSQIREYCANPTLDSEARKRLAERFAGPSGAGERMATGLLGILKL